MAIFVNKYVYTVFDLPCADYNIFYVGENEIECVWGRDRGWTIFGVFDVEGAENEKFNLFLALLLIWLKQQKEGVVVEMPESGSNEEVVWGSEYIVLCYTVQGFFVQHYTGFMNFG